MHGQPFHHTHIIYDANSHLKYRKLGKQNDQWEAKYMKIDFQPFLFRWTSACEIDRTIFMWVLENKSLTFYNEIITDEVRGV